MSAQQELGFNSVERIAEHLHVPEEAPARVAVTNSRPPAYWLSSSGGILVDKLAVQYTADSPLVLDNLSFAMKPKEKIGVVWYLSFIH